MTPSPFLNPYPVSLLLVPHLTMIAVYQDLQSPQFQQTEQGPSLRNHLSLLPLYWLKARPFRDIVAFYWLFTLLVTSTRVWLRSQKEDREEGK